MRILLTNDDGIMAPGLLALRRALAELGEVTIVAPTVAQSAVGHAITLTEPIRVHRMNLGDGLWGYGVQGSPADSVKLALLELLPERPDIVASGVNLGTNLGVNVLYSGTVAAAAEGAILPLVMFTVIFGVAATRVTPHYRDTINRGAKAVSETILVVVDWILTTAPIGVFALTLTLAAQTGASVIAAVAGFLAAVAILLTTATLALYPLVRVFGGVPMALFAKACAPAQAVGFSTRSSLASLPPMLEEADRTLQLKPEVSGLVLPAAVSVFKYASPMSRIVGTFFVASLFGVELGPLEIGSLAAGMGVLSFYSPGIPSGGLFVVAPLWMAFGLPMEGIGILIALDLIPDMILTVANVTGDLAVAAIFRGGTRSARSNS